MYHITAFSIGVLLDWLVGDPYWMPHPIRWIGSLIHRLDQRWMEPLMQSGQRDCKKEKWRGFLTVVTVIVLTAIATAAVLFICYSVHPYVGLAAEAILTCYILAARSLQKESMKVYDALEKEGIEQARYAVSMIVGRDTNCLDAAGVTKAAVETVAENTSDGVIAPLLYTCLGGPVLGMIYKAINTMDSMIGYHNERYEHFGRMAAKLDDLVNYLPARISAVCMIVTACLLKGTDGRNAWRIFKRDRYNHKSPNSAQTESVCAGALGLQLAGDASYFGKIVSKPYIGDANRTIESADIKRSVKLMYGTEIFVLIFCIVLMLLIWNSCR